MKIIFLLLTSIACAPSFSQDNYQIILNNFQQALSIRHLGRSSIKNKDSIHHFIAFSPVTTINKFSHLTGLYYPLSFEDIINDRPISNREKGFCICSLPQTRYNSFEFLPNKRIEITKGALWLETIEGFAAALLQSNYFFPPKN